MSRALGIGSNKSCNTHTHRAKLIGNPIKSQATATVPGTGNGNAERLGMKNMVSSANGATENQLHLGTTAEDVEQNPLKRRFWLLRQALNSGLSLAEALKVAAQIEAFVVDGTAPCSSNDTPNKAAAPPETARGTPVEISPIGVSSLLEPEKKAAITARLEAGASNALLAIEFGLTLRQVQGFRMQVGRRAKSKIAAVNRQQHGSSTNSRVIDEVVRYLRQQGDIVVADGPGIFLLNGLYRLDVDQLQQRADCIRQRQRKAELQIGDQLAVVPGVRRMQ